MKYTAAFYLAGAAAATMAGTAAHAQQSSYQIRAQDLAGALRDFGLQSGKSVAFTEASVRGQHSSGVVGRHDDDDALGVLLKGTSLSFRKIKGGFTILPRRESPARVIKAAVRDPAPLPPQQAAPPAPSEEPVEEIVVTAQGRVQTLQDVPISVSVMSGADMAKNNIQTMEGVANRVSAVKVTAGGAADALNIRGIGSGFDPGFEQSVATFVDGAYRSRSRSIRAAMFDVERVEVLKGPQTTFFGNNAIAGAFNITTRKPGDRFEYNASALYGSFGQYSLEGGVSIPVAPTLSVRVAGRAYGMNGYIDNAYTGKDGPHERNWIGRASAVWKPSDNFTSTLRFDRGRQRVKQANLAEVMFCPPADVPASGLCARYINANGGPVDDELDLHTDVYPGIFDYDFHELAWRNEIKFGDGYTLRSNTTYFNHDLQLNNVIFPVDIVGPGGLPGSFPFTNAEKQKTYSQEIRLMSPENRPFSFMIGGYYYHGKLDFQEYDVFTQAPFGLFLDPLYTADDAITTWTTFNQKDSIAAVFGSFTYKITDRFRVNGGLRYSVVHKKATRRIEGGQLLGSDPYPTAATFLPGTAAQQQAINDLFGNSAADVSETAKRTDKKLMPTISVQYDFAHDTTGYASFTKGFKAGGFSVYKSNPFEPENVDAYEIGVKSQLLDRRLTLNVAGFWSEFKDLQESSGIFLPNGQFITQINNAGKARSRGIELGLSARVSDTLRFYSDVAYVDSKYTFFPNGPCTLAQSFSIPNCVQDLGGKRRPFAPVWSGSSGATLTVPLHAMVLTFDPSMRFSSGYYQQVKHDPLLYQKGYAKFDARIAIGPEDKRWELAVIGKNLTDRITRSFSNNLGQTLGSIWAYPEEGRSFAIQFSIRN